MATAGRLQPPTEERLSVLVQIPSFHSAHVLISPKGKQRAITENEDTLRIALTPNMNK